MGGFTGALEARPAPGAAVEAGAVSSRAAWVAAGGAEGPPTEVGPGGFTCALGARSAPDAVVNTPWGMPPRTWAVKGSGPCVVCSVRAALVTFGNPTPDPGDSRTSAVPRGRKPWLRPTVPPSTRSVVPGPHESGRVPRRGAAWVPSDAAVPSRGLFPRGADATDPPFLYAGPPPAECRVPKRSLHPPDEVASTTSGLTGVESGKTDTPGWFVAYDMLLASSGICLRADSPC